MKRVNACLGGIFLAASFLFAISVHAQSPQDLLGQYVADLKKNSNDYALREKIIGHVQTMSPPPAIPEEARRQYVIARTLFDGSKKFEDFDESIAGFKSALLIAPWWADANRELGLALEAAQRYDEAIAYIKLYMAANPGGEHTRAAQDEIYKIEGKKKLAAKDREKPFPQAVAAPKQKTLEEFMRKIDGRRYRETRGGPAVLEVRGKSLLLTGPGVSGGPWEIIGRIARTARVMQSPPFPVQTTFTIDEVGDRIIERREFSDGDVREFTWIWQR